MDNVYSTSADTTYLGTLASSPPVVPAATRLNDESTNEEAVVVPLITRESSTNTDITPIIKYSSLVVEGEGEPPQKANPRNRMSTLTRLLERPAANPAFGNDPWRFVVVFSYSLLAASNAMQWLTFSPIPHEVGLFFHTTPTEINYLTSVYLIVYGLMVIVSCKVFEAMGLKKSLIVAAALNTTGAGVKIFAVYSFPRPPLLFVSQCINALAQVFIIAHPPNISNMWFGDGHRTMANATMTAAQNIGIAIAVVLPTLFIHVGHNESHDERCMHVLRVGFARFFWTQFAIALAALATILFLFPTRPKYAASTLATAAIQCDLQRIHRDQLRIHRKVIEKNLQRKRANQEQQMKKGPKQVAQGSDGSHITPTLSPPVLYPMDGTASTCIDGHLYFSLPGAEPTAEFASNGDDVACTCVPEEVEERIQRSLVAAVALAAAESAHNDCVPQGSGATQDDIEEIILSLEAKLERIHEAEREYPRINIFHILRDSIRVVEQNTSFARMIFSSSMQFGATWSLATVIPQAVSPLGVSERMAGWIGFANLVVGGLTAPVFAPFIVGRQRNFKGAWIGCSVVILLDLSVMLILLLAMAPVAKAGEEITEDSLQMLLILFIGWGGIGGMVQNVLLPLLFEFGTELTFPVSTTTTATVTIWTGNLSCFILTQVFSFVLGSHPGVKEMSTLWCIAIWFTLLGGLGILSVDPHRFREAHKANLHRLHVDARRASRISVIATDEPNNREGCHTRGGGE